MARQKYDWAALKNEYLLSDIEDVKEFIRVRLGSDKVANGGIQKATTGWKDQKQTFRTSIREQVLEEQKQKLLDRERQTLEIAAGENLVIYAGYEKLKKDVEDAKNGKTYIKMSPVSMKELFSMFRTEQGKSLGSTNTNITENADAAEIAKNLLTAEQEQNKLIDDILSNTPKDTSKE